MRSSAKLLGRLSENCSLIAAKMIAVAMPVEATDGRSNGSDETMAKFKVTYDAVHKLLELKLEGYWSMDDFREYEAEMGSKHVQITKRTPFYRVLSDVRDFAVQSKEVGEAFGNLSNYRGEAEFGRFAILVSSALSAMQAKHVSPNANVRVFTNEAEARKWLLEEGSLPG